MQLKLGKKIKELRRRDGRTQEALAEALGVSAQAISRWESGGGYPDMESIPAIANYFHVSIDELFGYSLQREEKIQEILHQAENMITLQSNMEPCVCLLREAVAEFPSEARLLEQLGYALVLYGQQTHGARQILQENAEYAEYDTDFNRQNKAFEEAIDIFERLLSVDMNADSRLAVITNLVRLLALRGEEKRAEALAQSQDYLMISRECLLANATTGKKRHQYHGEALLALLRECKGIILNAVLTQPALRKSQAGLEKLLAAAHFYKSVLDDENCGFGHFDLCELYHWSAVLAAKLGYLSQALDYFEFAFDHAKQYHSIRNTGTYQYTAALVQKVTFPSANWPALPPWNSWLKHTAPDNLLEAIKKEEKYKELFPQNT